MSAARPATLLAAAVCAAAGAISGAFDAASGLLPLDLGLLGEAADTLLSSQWARAFASPEVQVGPLHLLVVGLLRAGARILGTSHRLVLAVAIEAGAALALFGLARGVLGRPRPLMQAGAGLAVVLGGSAWTAYVSGHPEELAIGALWICAALAALRGRGARAGLCLAAAAALKASGALGLPLLLLVPPGRDRRVGLVTMAAGCVLSYLPFLLFGDVRTFEYSWVVRSDVWVALFGPTFTWWMRLVQGAVVVALGVALVHRLRARAGVVWLAPLVLVGLRVVLDPHPQPYFWLPFEAASIVGATALAGSASFLRASIGAAASYAGLLARYLPTYAGWGMRAVTGAVLMSLATAEGSRLDPTPPGALGPGGEETVAGADRSIEPLSR